MPVENEYEYEEEDDHSTSKYSFKNKCVMAILFVVCAVVGGYFGYATMKSVDSIIKENHHRPTINSMVVDFHKSYIA
jgi:H+/Cl- antiporter ClcA